MSHVTFNLRRQQYKHFWRTNDRIIAGQLRVIGEDGKQVGILGKDEALRKAQEAGLDLVEIAPTAKPPVAKIIDFTKFKYQQEKKEREERKKEKKGTTLKEIWLRPFIAEGDYRVRLERIREFLGENAKVRITVKSKRRIDKTEPLYKILRKIVEDLKEISRVEQEPKMLGRQLVTILAPYHAKEKNEEDKNENQKVGSPPIQSDSEGESPAP